MIRIDYDQSRAAAQKLSNAASECGSLVSKANQLNAAIPACWEGEAATAFSVEIENWSRETRAIQQDLVSVAEDILRIVREFEEAEAKLAGEVNSFGVSGFW